MGRSSFPMDSLHYMTAPAWQQAYTAVSTKDDNDVPVAWSSLPEQLDAQDQSPQGRQQLQIEVQQPQFQHQEQQPQQLQQQFEQQQPQQPQQQFEQQQFEQQQFEQQLQQAQLVQQQNSHAPAAEQPQVAPVTGWSDQQYFVWVVVPQGNTFGTEASADCGYMNVQAPSADWYSSAYSVPCASGQYGENFVCQWTGDADWEQAQLNLRPPQPQQKRDRLSKPDGKRRTRHALAVGAQPRVDSTFAESLHANLKAGSESASSALASLRGRVARFSFEAAGCRAVQEALEVADRHTAAELAEELRGIVVKAIDSPYGNYVVQKVVAVLTPREAPFIVEEVRAQALELARHEYGVRIFCRLLEHSANDESTVSLIDQVLMATDDLVQTRYGHHLVECAIEHGNSEQRKRIIAVLTQHAVRNVWDKSAVYVVEKALIHGEEVDRNALAHEILSQPSYDVAAMATNQLGSMIARALLKLQRPIVEKLATHLDQPVAQSQLMKNTRHGKKFIDLLCAALDLDREASI